MARRYVDSKMDFRTRQIAVQLMKEWNNLDEVAAVLGCTPDVVEKVHLENRITEKDVVNLFKELGRPTKLSDNQVRIIERMIFTSTPNEMGYSTLLWSNKVIRDIIFDLFQIKLSLSSVNALIQKMGVSRRQIFRNKRNKYTSNNDSIGDWYINRLPVIQKIAKENHARIFFVCNDHIIDSSFGKRHTKEVIGSETKNAQGGNGGFRLLSANCLRKSQRFLVFRGDLSVLQLIDFIKKLIIDIEKPLFLIFENHYQKLFMDSTSFLSEHDKQLAFFYLPITINDKH